MTHDVVSSRAPMGTLTGYKRIINLSVGPYTPNYQEATPSVPVLSLPVLCLCLEPDSIEPRAHFGQPLLPPFNLFFHPAPFIPPSTFLFHTQNLLFTLYSFFFDPLPFLFHPPSFGWCVGWLAG